jgi:hypothetical protein
MGGGLGGGGGHGGDSGGGADGGEGDGGDSGGEAGSAARGGSKGGDGSDGGEDGGDGSAGGSGSEGCTIATKHTSSESLCIFLPTGGKHVSASPVSFEKSSHPSRDTQRSSWGRCNHTATSHSLSFSDLRRGTSASPLPSRTSRRRSQALKGHARGTRGRLIVRHVICSALESAIGRRAVGFSPPRPDIECLRASPIGGGAAGHGRSSHAGFQSGCGLRAPAGAGRGRSTVAGFGASYGSPLGADPRTACMTSVCD